MSKPNQDLLFTEALSQHIRGDLEAAVLAYKSILVNHKDHADTLHHLGIAHIQMGKVEEAIRWIERSLKSNGRQPNALVNLAYCLGLCGQNQKSVEICHKAIELDPRNHGAWTNLANAQRSLGKLLEAEFSYRRALDIQPQNTQYRYNLANVTFDLKEYEKAYTLFLKCLEIDPNIPEVHNNISACLLELDDLEGALKYVTRALELEPRLHTAWNNKGKILAALGKYSEAAASYQCAIELKPKVAEFWNNLGAALHEANQIEDAVSKFDNALTIRPDFPECWLNRGAALHDLKCRREALASYDRAISLKVNFAEAWANKANTLRELGLHELALQSYDRAIELEPDNPLFRLFYVTATLPIIPRTEKESRAAIETFKIRSSELRAWLSKSDRRRESFRQVIGQSQPFYLAYRPGNHLEALSRYGEMLCDSAGQVDNQNIISSAKSEKIHLLVVSAHIYRHSVWDILTKGIFQHLDRSKFKLSAFYLGNKVLDQETIWASEHADEWLDKNQIQRRNDWLFSVRKSAPDIIFYPEIGMDPDTLFLASHRLAPIQMASWGHPITTGLKTVDYFLSGKLIEGAHSANHYLENLVLLPGTGCCTEAIEIQSEYSLALERVLSDLPRPIFLICQNPCKIDPTDDSLFAEIALRVKECSFLFVEFDKNAALLETLIDRVGKSFRKLSLDPNKYLHRSAHLARPQFYALLDECDIYLDSPNFSGYTTAWQAVHRGLPIVTLEGEFMRQRLAAGLLRQIGHVDTIAKDRDEYVDIAAGLAIKSRDPQEYQSLRKTIRLHSRTADHRVEVVRALEKFMTEATNRYRS